MNLFRRRQREAELDAEIRSHLDEAIRDRIERGETPDEARHNALREFGNVGLVKEVTREMWGWASLERFVQDLRYGLRVLFKQKGFTTIAVFSLALGIGANTAIFSVIDVLMLRTLPVRNPEQLVMFRLLVNGHPWDFLSNPLSQKLRELTRIFADISVIYSTDRSNVRVSAPGGSRNDSVEAGQVRVALVSGNYFPMLGVSAVAGRTLTPDDDRLPGGHPVAVISYRYWESRFARASDVVRRTLTLNGTTYDIIGVTPRGFSGDWIGRPADLWIPAMMAAQVVPDYPGLLTTRGSGWRIVGRLQPGLTIQQAQAAAQALHQQFLAESPNPEPERTAQMARERLVLIPGASGYSPEGEAFAPSLAILLAMVGLVLLIACTNVANLLLARGAARQQEIAVRLAIGAGRARIVRQLLAESLLLATFGGMLGLLFSVWGTSVLAATVGSGPVRMDSRAPSAWISFDLHLDLRVFAFTGALCLLTGMLFGLAPAFRGSKVSLASALGGRGVDSGSSGGRRGPGRLLVISQVALSLVLLVGAGLFARTLWNLKTQNLGFDREHLLLGWTSLSQTGRRGAPAADFWKTVQDRLSSLPGVLSASASNSGVLNGAESMGGTVPPLRVEGQALKPAGLPGWRTFVAPKYFETMGIPLLAGRDFTEQDNQTAPRVVIINQSMARYYFGAQNPIGRHVGFGGDVGTPTEIVGVVQDFKHGTPREKDLGLTYFPYRQLNGPIQIMCLAVRTAGNPTGMIASLRQELRDIDPNLPVLRIDTVEEQLNDVLVQDRLIAGLASFFGLVGALLACLGLYGVISWTVARRTNEIGIRLALGATPAVVLRMVLKESMWLVCVGIAIGLPMTLAVTRLVATRLFGVSAADPLTIAVATLLMLAVAALAAFLPARRASRVDPMVALRCE
ncbi:MAG: ADOP family duplicated permease [Blastocatellia bacterium]